jgi:hypothetical protein
MSIKLGNTDVSFRLGAGEVAAIYRGAQEVWSAVPPEPATLYFDGAVNNAWTTVGNWWLDDAHTEPAGRLPAEIDSVVVTNTPIDASGQTVVNVTMGGEGGAFGGEITVTGMATFNGAVGHVGTVNGNATFNDFATNAGTVNGNATFNDSSVNAGTVTGTITDNR